MKLSLHTIIGIFLSLFLFSYAQAQNTFPTSGNAGIGTTAPGSPLTIKASNFGLEHTNGTVSVKTYLSTIYGQVGTYSNHPFQLMANNGVNQFVLLPNGNVGVGVATPAAKLDVNGDALINGLTIGRGYGSDTTSFVAGYKALGANKNSSRFMIAIGCRALNSNTTGTFNIANGYQALYSNTTGYSNLAIGDGSMFYNIGGFANISLGGNSLYFNTSGYYNIAIGGDALFDNQTGTYNTAVGNNVMSGNTTGYENTAFGSEALYKNKTGYYNTAVGYQALEYNTTGNYNTALGYNAGVSVENLHNATALGYNADVNASNKVVVGDNNVTVIGGKVGWSTLSDGRFKKDIQTNVPGLAFINKLKPVTYHLELQKFEKFLGRKDSLLQAMKPSFEKEEATLRTGFIAQEVEAAAKDIHYDFDGVNHPQSDKDNYSLVYSGFVPSMVKAIQELSQQNNDKEDKIATLQTQLNTLQEEVEAIKSLMNNSAATAMTGAKTVPSLSNASLEQNIPNPSTATTVIRYTLPSGYSRAQLVVTGANGSVIKQLPVSGSGAGSITLSTSSLSAGAYHYSLYIDGKLAGTKQMIVGK